MTAQRTEVLRLASTGKKATKAQIAKLILTMADDPALRGHTDDLADLYRYFAPKAPTGKPTKDPWAWLCQAINPKDARPVLRYVYCDGDHAWATDGHRLHRIADGRAQGLYDPVSQTRMYSVTWQPSEGEHPGAYPDVHRLVERHDYAVVGPAVANLAGQLRSNAVSRLTATVDGEAVESMHINSAYLAQARAGMAEPQAAYTADSRAVVLTDCDGDKLAIIIAVWV